MSATTAFGIRRPLALALGATYLLVCLLGVVIYLDEGQDFGWEYGAIALLAATAAVFLAAAWRPASDLALALRIAMWLIMAAGSVYLISFSFVLWPMLLVGLPGVLPLRRKRDG